MNASGRSTGDAFGHALLSMAASDDRIVSVEVGDSAWTSPFAESYPERRFNAGAAEQNLILTAAGLALGGDNVFVSS